MNFLDTAKSSLAEIGYCIHSAQRLGYITEKIAGDLDLEIRKVGAPLAGLIRSEQLKQRAGSATILILIVLFGTHLL